jgi:6-phosphogluconolactonase
MQQNIIERTTLAELTLAAAPLVAEAIAQVSRRQRICRIGIVGGRSIPALLRALEPYPLEGHIDLYWLDERAGTDKNYLDATPILEDLRRGGADLAWYPLRSLTEDALLREGNEIISQLAITTGRAEFDIVIVSAGDDGHIASIFPGREDTLAQEEHYVLVRDAPKPPPLRVTVTPALIRTAKTGFILFVDKEQARAHFTNPEMSVIDCPAKIVLSIPNLTLLVKK